MSYIVPRDKPKRCTQPKCRFMDRNTLDCRLQGKSWESFEEQYEHCPLIEIHTPPAEPMVDIRDTQYNLPVGTDLISRQAVLDALNNIEIPRNASWYQYYQQALTAVDKLPPAQPERIIHCKDCKHHWKHKCMDSMSIEKCDLGQTFYDAEVDYCSLAERREVTE